MSGLISVSLGNKDEDESQRLTDGTTLFHRGLPRIGRLERQRGPPDRLYAHGHVAQRLFLHLGEISRGRSISPKC